VKCVWDENEIDASLRSHLATLGVDEAAMAIVDADDAEGLRGWVARWRASHERSETPPVSNFAPVVGNPQVRGAQAAFGRPQVNGLLAWSSWRGAANCAATLIDELSADSTGSDGAGRSCLHLSAVAGQLDAARVLLTRGARVDAFDRHRMATPLFCAAVASDGGASIDLLLAHGADINAGLHELGVSALHCAVRANAVDNVRILLGRGAVPNSVQLFSETPLHTAASMGYDDCVRLLIDHGACLEVG